MNSMVESKRNVVTMVSEKAKFRLRCLCLQRVSPTVVVQDVKSLDVADWIVFQEWFVQACFMDDYYTHRKNNGTGDALYWKNLLHKCVKASHGVMSESMADALIALDSILEENDSCMQETASWLHKTYMYGPADGEMEELYMTANSNMFQGSTGCFEWDAGYFLAEYVMNHAEMFRSRVCIELGCGCGMVGAVMSRLEGGIQPVICTDGDWETLGNCEHNMKQNNVSVVHQGDGGRHGVALVQFQWEDGWLCFEQQIKDILASRGRETPVSLIGADLLYDPEIIPVIVPLISEFLEHMRDRPGSSVYLSTKRRSEDTLQKFLDAVNEYPHVKLDNVGDEISYQNDANAWRFFHIPSLDASRDSIILHRLTLQQK